MPTEAAAPGLAARMGWGSLLAALAGIYTSQTLLSTIAMQSLPSLLRQAGVPLQLAGLSALFMLPWALRFSWSPAVERWRLPAGTCRRRSRAIILGGQALLALGLGAAALAGMGQALSLHAHAGWLLGIFFAAAMLSATVDIACGGLAVEQLAPARRGWGSAVKVGSGYLGMLLGSSLFLLLAHRLGWPQALGATAAVMAVLMWPLWRLREPERQQPGPPRAAPSLRGAWRQPHVRRGLLLAFVLGAGVRTAAGMVGPWLLDNGVPMEKLAWLFGLFSVGAGLAGAALGGGLTRWAPGWRAVRLSLALQTGVLSLLAWAAGPGAWPPAALAPVAGGLFLSMACGFVTLYAALMGLASPHQPGVDFALFQSADAAMAVLGGVAGGWLAGRWGYGACFALAAIWAGAALLRAPLHEARP